MPEGEVLLREKHVKKSKKESSKRIQISKQEHFDEKEKRAIQAMKDKLQIEREKNKEGLVEYKLSPEEIEKRYGTVNGNLSNRSSLEGIRFMQIQKEDEEMARKKGSRNKPKTDKVDKRLNPSEEEDQQSRIEAKQIAKRVAEFLEEEMDEETHANGEFEWFNADEPEKQIHDDNVDALTYTTGEESQDTSSRDQEDREDIPSETPQEQLPAVIQEQPK